MMPASPACKPAAARAGSYVLVGWRTTRDAWTGMLRGWVSHQASIMHIPPEESLIEYPSDFPIKVMGKQHPELAQTLTEVVLQFDPGFDAATVEMRPSKGGNYMGLTFTVRAPRANSSMRCTARCMATPWCRSSSRPAWL